MFALHTRFRPLLLALAAAFPIAGAAPLFAAPVVLTPPSTLVLNGVNVNQGIFTLLSASTVDILASLPAGPLVQQDLISSPVTIDPAVIGSGATHVLFDAPDVFLPLNFLSFTFEQVDPVPTGPLGGIVGGVVVSALPEFSFSLPATPGIVAFLEFIDVGGNRLFASSFSGVGFAPDPSAAVNLDIFGDGSFFFHFSAADLSFVDPLTGSVIANARFQDHGRLSGFTRPVPEPSAVLLMLAGSLGLAAWGRRSAHARA